VVLRGKPKVYGLVEHFLAHSLGEGGNGLQAAKPAGSSSSKSKSKGRTGKGGAEGEDEGQRVVRGHGKVVIRRWPLEVWAGECRTVPLTRLVGRVRDEEWEQNERAQAGRRPYNFTHTHYAYTLYSSHYTPHTTLTTLHYT
jgi:hypothetical protein